MLFNFLFFNWLFSSLFIYFLTFRCSTVQPGWSRCDYLFPPRVSSSVVWRDYSHGYTVNQIKELVLAGKKIFFCGFD